LTHVPTKWWRVRYRYRFRAGAKLPYCHWRNLRLSSFSRRPKPTDRPRDVGFFRESQILLRCPIYGWIRETRHQGFVTVV
jgi:hypothetical protein